MSDTFFRESIPDIATPVADSNQQQEDKSREYWELEGSPFFDMRATRIERHDVTRMFICKRQAIPTLIEDAINDRLEWGQGPEYKGEVIGVRLRPIGAPEGQQGAKAASYTWWEVHLMYGTVTPVLLTKTRVTERVEIQMHPAMYPVDFELYTRESAGNWVKVSSAGVYEGPSLSALRYTFEIRNAAYFNTGVLQMVGTVNGPPLVTLAHGTIFPRCALFMGADSSITIQLGMLPRWHLRFEWMVKTRPWDVPLGLEPFAGNLWVRYKLGSADRFVPFKPIPEANHNMVFSSFSW